MKKKIPAFKSARAAAAFVDKADLSQYDLSGAQTVRFEMKRKDKSINLRLPEELYDAVRQRATHAGLPYQRFIRLALENAIAGHGVAPSQGLVRPEVMAAHHHSNEKYRGLYKRLAK
jgi:predicted DNA binding CopG/RHH family protein